MKKVCIFFALMLVLASCASITAPTRAAETAEQKAFALYGTFVVFEELAADIVEDPAVPTRVLLDIREADMLAKSVVDSLLGVALETNRIRRELEAGNGTAERLTIATNNLRLWTQRAGPLVTNLVNAVNKRSK